MNYVLDTNVISELVAAQPHPQVIHWVELVDPNQVFLCVIVVGELKRGIEKLPKSKRKERLDQWLREDLLVRFQKHLIPIDTDTMLLWGTLNARLEALGRPMSAIDALLAATVLQYQYTLVTRNTDHFENAGILLINPWNG
jgi:predicted nucleic acid-binding protein